MRLKLSRDPIRNNIVYSTLEGVPSKLWAICPKLVQTSLEKCELAQNTGLSLYKLAICPKLVQTSLEKCKLAQNTGLSLYKFTIILPKSSYTLLKCRQKVARILFVFT